MQTLTMGASSASAYIGDIMVTNLYNYQSSLLLAGTAHVNDTLGLYAGTVQLGIGAQLVLGNGSTIDLGGGSYQVGTGSITLQGNVNLLYSGAGSRDMALEMNLSPINNMTINMAQGGQINMTDDIAVTGKLDLQGGKLNLNGYDLTINGKVSGSGGSIIGDSVSSVTVNGTDSVGLLVFDSVHSKINSLKVNIGGSGSVILGSNLTTQNGIILTAGTLMLGSNQLTSYGDISGNGTLSTTSNSALTIDHNGHNTYLKFAAGADTIGNLSISSGINGSSGVASNLTVMGTFSLGSGTFSIDEHDVTLNGNVDSLGSGTISGGYWGTGNLTIGGNAAQFGTLKFNADSNAIRNLTVNNVNSGWVYLGTSLTINQSVNLNGGRIGLIDTSNLVIIGTDTIHGGSANSYIATIGTGKVYINIPDSTSLNGYDNAMLHIGTEANYAPLRIYNNGSQVGTFGANAHPGVFKDGESGEDLAATETVVNTSWNLTSNLDSSVNVSVEVFWTAGMEVNQFNRNDVQLKHYTAGAWDSTTSAQATVHANGMASVRRDNIPSFSPFAVFSKPLTTSISGPAAETLKFSLFPNPANSQTTLALATADKNYELRITDLAGKQVAFYNVHHTNSTINVNDFAPGIYFFTLNNQHTQRFVKQ